MAYNQYVARVGFPHTAMSSFYKSLTSYFKEYVYPFSNVVFASFHKAIKYISDLNNQEENITMGMLVPFITLSSTLGEPVKETAFLWKYGNLHPYQVNWFQDGIVFQDGHLVNVITNRFSGTVEFNVFAESQMEIQDIMLNIHDSFRGFNKWTPMLHMESFFVMDKNIILKTINGNEIFDWNSTSLKKDFIPGINSEKYYYPTYSNPQVMLNSMSDSSSFYGGSGLPEYSLNGSLTFEIEIPTLITLSTFIDVKSVSAGIGVESFVKNSEDKKPNTAKDYVVVDDEIHSAISLKELEIGPGPIHYPLVIDCEDIVETDIIMINDKIIKDFEIEDSKIIIKDLGMKESDIGFGIRVLRTRKAACSGDMSCVIM